jgi:hypothetical protein
MRNAPITGFMEYRPPGPRVLKGAHSAEASVVNLKVGHVAMVELIAITGFQILLYGELFVNVGRAGQG